MTILTYLSIYLSIYIYSHKKKKKKKKKETHSVIKETHLLWNPIAFITFSMKTHTFSFVIYLLLMSNFIAIHVQIFSTFIVHKMLTFKDYYNTINNHSSRTQKYYNFQKWFWKEHSLLAKSTLFNFIRIAFQQNITKHN